MQSQCTTCTYTPLDDTKQQIRLLHIRPLAGHKDTATIECFLSLVSLEDHPIFEALSYVWGDPTDAAIIDLEGHRMPVTVNLHSALKHLRYTDEERII